MINPNELMTDLNRYKDAYDVLAEKYKDKEEEVRYWIDLFNAARYVAWQAMIKMGADTSHIDDLIIRRRDIIRKKETK